MRSTDSTFSGLVTGATQMDVYATPASHNLVQPREIPFFETDERERSFAMADDREDRRDEERLGQPLTIRETTPD